MDNRSAGDAQAYPRHRWLEAANGSLMRSGLRPTPERLFAETLRLYDTHRAMTLGAPPADLPRSMVTQDDRRMTWYLGARDGYTPRGRTTVMATARKRVVRSEELANVVGPGRFKGKRWQP